MSTCGTASSATTSTAAATAATRAIPFFTLGTVARLARRFIPIAGALEPLIGSIEGEQIVVRLKIVAGQARSATGSSRTRGRSRAAPRIASAPFSHHGPAPDRAPRRGRAGGLSRLSVRSPLRSVRSLQRARPLRDGPAFGPRAAVAQFAGAAGGRRSRDRGEGDLHRRGLRLRGCRYGLRRPAAFVRCGSGPADAAQGADGGGRRPARREPAPAGPIRGSASPSWPPAWGPSGRIFLTRGTGGAALAGHAQAHRPASRQLRGQIIPTGRRLGSVIPVARMRRAAAQSVCSPGGQRVGAQN